MRPRLGIGLVCASGLLAVPLQVQVQLQLALDSLTHTQCGMGCNGDA